MAVHFGDVTFDDTRRMLHRGSEPLFDAALSVLENIVDEPQHAIRLNTEPLREDLRLQLLLRRTGFARS